MHHRADLNTLGLVANHARHHGGEEWLRQANEYVSATHDFVVNFVDDKIPMIKVHRAEGTYLTWLDVTGVAEKINSKKLADDYNRTKPANMPSLTPEQMVERFFVKTAKVHLNQGALVRQGRREPHAHEHRHVAQAGRARPEQHGGRLPNATTTNLNMLF